MESRIVNTAIALLVLLTLFIIGMYFTNPFNTASLDPRSRIIGYHPFRISSNAMAPTLNKGDIVISSHWAYLKKLPERKDIIIFRAPFDPSKIYVKRIIGLPGETVAIREGNILLNNNLLAENYLTTTAKQDFSLEMKELHVPEKSYFVLGDNRDNSHDSRFWGAVPYDSIEGKVVRKSQSTKE